MRKNKQTRRQKILMKPLDKTFKYPVTCIKCGKGFLVAEEGLDLSNLRCDICKGKLKYKNGKWIRSKKKMKGKEHQKLSKAQEEFKEQLSMGVKELLKQLTETKDSEEKKRLRRLLRRRGHSGGLCLKGKKK